MSEETNTAKFRPVRAARPTQGHAASSAARWLISRRSLLPVSLLLIATRVIRYSSQLPHQEDAQTEREHMLRSVRSAFRLPLALLSAIVAGAIGAQFGSARSSLALVQVLNRWTVVLLLIFSASVITAWHRILSRWATWLNGWVSIANQLTSVQLRDFDVAAVGFEVNDYYRSRIRVKGVTWFSILSSLLGFLLIFAFARLNVH